MHIHLYAYENKNTSVQSTTLHDTHSLKMYDKSLGSLGKIDLWHVHQMNVEVEQVAKGN